jgi:hypothetical protein
LNFCPQEEKLKVFGFTLSALNVELDSPEKKPLVDPAAAIVGDGLEAITFPAVHKIVKQINKLIINTGNLRFIELPFKRT